MNKSKAETKSKEDLKKLSVSLDINNSDLASLVGPMDTNIAQIETFLNVDISRRGSVFTVAGPLEAARKGVQAISDLAKARTFSFTLSVLRQVSKKRLRKNRLLSFVQGARV